MRPVRSPDLRLDAPRTGIAVVRSARLRNRLCPRPTIALYVLLQNDCQIKARCAVYEPPPLAGCFLSRTLGDAGRGALSKHA